MGEPTDNGAPATAAKTANTIKVATPKDIFDGAKYKRVIFDQKSNPTDANDVVLAVQGFTIKCQRGVETIVPDFILDAADHATYAKYRVVPGEGRKVGERIRKFPYKVIGEATASEFKALFAAGTKKTREAIAAHGLNIPIEKAVSQDLE